MGNTIKTWCVRLWASAVVILTGNLPILYDKFLGIWGMIFLLVFYFIVTTLIISKKPGNTGISRDIRTEFTTDLLLSD